MQHTDQQHKTPWFSRPDWRNALPSFEQSDHREFIEQFARDGYVIVDATSYTPEAGATIRTTLTPQLGPGARVHDAWKTVEEAKQLACDQQIMSFLEEAYRRQPIPFQTLHFSHGSQQPVHSDSLHFHTLPARWMCGIWIALEEVHEKNGPLCVYPGSHRLPVWELQDFGIKPGLQANREYEELLALWIEEQGLEKKRLTVQPGQAVIWAANLLHGGEPILDEASTRWSQVTHCIFADTVAYSPRRSDLHQGKMFILNLHDIRTQQPIAYTVNGKPFTPSADQEFWMQPSIWSFCKAILSRIRIALAKILKSKSPPLQPLQRKRRTNPKSK